ncbi:uncharacterized protein N7459_004183 [Penicillium hispanicum]|uniref:uncharacterized protein n=1 Tax=Penicillium hispanicum TaxID=1080232 RepID=UPI002541835F|nr:uncharacterized protein N7459_004183 [Penicillium hispanicum]KAJ5584383.1 hypothetical protein N7459_004183 [Penicillium hispanicum]
MKLTDCPNEILLLINDNIENKSDRYHLAITSRRLYNTLLLLLYSSVEIRNCQPSSIQSIRTVCTFLRAVVQNSVLAKAVRHLKLDPWDTEGLTSVPTSQFSRKLLGRVVREVGITKKARKSWRHQLRTGNTDVWLALLISRLQGLKILEIKWPVHPVYVPRMFEKAARENPSMFPNLEELSATCLDPEAGFPSYFIDPFFRLPALRRVCVDNIREFSNHSTGDHPGPPFSNVTQLDMHTRSAPCGMLHWISYCKGLRSIHLSHSSDNRPAYFLVEDFYQALQLHTRTLESIWVCDDHRIYGPGNGTLEGSFACFTVLKDLHIGARYLVGAGSSHERWRQVTLPPSLERFCLCNCDDSELLWAVERLRAMISSLSLPNLAQLTLKGSRHQDFHDPEVRSLGLQCQEAGVYFRLAPAKH